MPFKDASKSAKVGAPAAVSGAAAAASTGSPVASGAAGDGAPAGAGFEAWYCVAKVFKCVLAAVIRVCAAVYLSFDSSNDDCFAISQFAFE